MMILALYLATGILAGVLAGLFGIGGGLIVVPLLIKLFSYLDFPSHYIMHMAVGSSLAVMIFTTASATFSYHRRALVQWKLFFDFVPGLLIGVSIGFILVHKLSNSTLQIAFGILLLLIAAFMSLNYKVEKSRQLPGFLGLTLLSIIVGLLSGFFGIGGGILSVPFFIYCNVEIYKAVGTSGACNLSSSILGTLGYIINGMFIPSADSLPVGSIGYVYWPAVLTIAIASMICAPLGAQIALKLPTLMLKRIFAFLLVITAISIFLE